MPRAETVAGSGGLEKLVLRGPGGSRAEVYPYGAHLTSWIPAGGSEAIFLSRAARFGQGQSIRGGIPVIFPQFADLGPFPRHGFVRTQTWEIARAASASSATLQLRDSDATRRAWPHAFLAALHLDVGESMLSIRLTIRNEDRAAFSFTAALHTYFRIGDVARSRVHGLKGAPYRDRAAWDQVHVETGEELAIAGEIDRVYADTPGAVTLRDPVMGRTFRIAQEGFRDTVVWNPAAALADLEAAQWPQMLCVEAARVMNPVSLEPEERWDGTLTVEVFNR